MGVGGGGERVLSVFNREKGARVPIAYQAGARVTTIYPSHTKLTYLLVRGRPEELIT
jgi:hypothetical protein